MATALTFNWSGLSGSIAGGASQDTGGINVGVTYVNDLNGSTSTVSSTSQFVDTANGETFATNSALLLGGSGGVANTSTTTLNFSAISGSGFSGEVDNVTFRINDFDASTWIDVITVRAYDADDNLLTVNLTWNGDSFSGTEETLTSNGTNVSASTETGSILVEIAGPVAYIEIDYDNNGTGGQELYVTDVHFDAVDVPDGTVEGTSGADVIDDAYEGDPERDMVDNDDAILAGDTGDDDLIYGYAGDDSISAGAGDDEVYGGDGSDTINISAGEGTDAIEGGEDGDGADFDVLSFSDSTGTSGVNVTLSGDEEGSYVFPSDGGDGTFTEIEQLSLTEQDDTFDGTLATGGNTVNGGDGSDSLFGSAGADSFDGGDGDDWIAAGEGNDTIVGGGGDEIVRLEENFGNDTIVGGETGEFFGDIIDATSVTVDLSLDLSAVSASDNESGTLSDGTSTANFEEIEGILLGTGDDSIIGSSGNDTVSTNEGADTINLGAGDDELYIGTSVGSPDGDADTIILQDGSGNDQIFGFDAPTANGDGTFTGIDTFDVSALNDAGGDPVNTNDVTVSDDGSGNALLTFPNGESVTLDGISPTDADDPFYLNAIGIPLPDGTVSGTSGDDTIDVGYVGDPDGDMVDDNDAILAGDVGDDDLIEAYGGADSIEAGAGNDEVYGGTGADTIAGGEDDDTLFGGATDEVGNLIVNGSFEDLTGTVDTVWGDQGTGSIVGWTDYNGGEFDLHDNGKGGTYATDGTHVLDMGSTLDNLHIYQDITSAVTGETYTLSLDAGDVNGGGNSVEVYWGGDLIATIDPTEGGMESFSFDLIGGSGDGANRLEFKEIGPIDVHGVQLDNIQLIGAYSTAATQDTAGDTIDGGAGNDSVYGLQGDDELDGGSDDDKVFGGQGSDDINVSAGEGTDTIVGGEDVDGADIDTLTFTDGTGADGVDVVMTDDEDGTYAFPTAGGDGSFAAIENIVLTDQDDTFDGTLATSGNTVDAGAGDDVLTGSTGADDFDGDAGDDTVIINDSFGDDTIVGGETGESNGDVIDGSALTENIIVDFSGPESGTITGTIDEANFSEIEAIETGSGDDSVLGDSGDDVVTTNDGNDVVFGGAGDDTFDTGADDDSLTGGTGSDSLSAGAGNDTVTFSEGDTVDGGSGDDVIVLEDLGETGNGTITIDGGAGDETGGDTLQLGSLGVLTQDVRDTFVDDGTGSYSGSITLDDGTTLNFSEIENIICFTPGTRIATPYGLVAIEDLEVGDLVVTRDHGLQPIRWLEGRVVPAVDRFAPVRIRKNVLAGQDRDLLVSPQHRVLFQGYRAELLFGESEVLVSAKHLVDGLDVTQDEQDMVTYLHIMFDRHEVIYAEGAATESFHPGDIGWNAVGEEAREELFAIFPELRADQTIYGNTARRCLRSHEAKLIRS